jgi:hypothetical protein
MPQANFEYSATVLPDEPGGLPLTLAIFADRPHVRDQLRDDALCAGFRVTETGGIDALLDEDVLALAEVVLVDCPAPDMARLAALARLDLRLAHAGAQLIVATSVEALDDVFGCLNQSLPQILVDARPVDLALALGRARALAPGQRVRELMDDDRLSLMRLTEQVGEIAARLERLGTSGQSVSGGAFRFESPAHAYAGEAPKAGERLARSKRPALPDPLLVRKIARQRQLRSRFFAGELFADPAWDMLLDLTAARAEHKRVSVSSLCIASGVPPTTALRWISQMNDAGLFERVEDPSDRRRAFIALTDKAADGMARYFAEIGEDARQLV